MTARDLIALLDRYPDADVVVRVHPTFERGDEPPMAIVSAEFEAAYLGTDRFVLILKEPP